MDSFPPGGQRHKRSHPDAANTTSSCRDLRSRTGDASTNLVNATKPRRSTRIRLAGSNPITCLDYGRDRKTVFPEYFFCGRCDNWESFVDTGTVGSKKRHSERNKCEANHQNPCHPTTIKKNVVRGWLLQAHETDTDTEMSSDDNTSESDDEDSQKCESVQEQVMPGMKNNFH